MGKKAGMANLGKKVDWEARRNSWCEFVNALMKDVEAWAGRRKWPVDRQEKTVTEDHAGTYSVPELNVKVPGGYLTLEPVGCNVIGADGRVDITAFPSLDRVMLVLVGKEWRLKTDSGVPWPKLWCEETFEELAQLLTSST